MARLRDVAKLIRSKNAGAFQLTYDIMFPDRQSYDHVVASGVISKQSMSRLLHVAESDIQIFNYEPANAIKVSIPRLVSSGDPADSDLFGCQQFGPLVDIEVPPLA